MGSHTDRVSCEEKKNVPLESSTHREGADPASPQSVASPKEAADKLDKAPGIPQVSPQVDVLRKRQNMTQQELAIQVGVTVTTISKWENGESGTETIRRFARLCEVLCCDIEEVVNVTQNEEMAPRIADLRKQRGLSQRSLAEAIGATEITIANWERGRSGLDWIERLIRLCDALDCKITELIVYNTQEVPAKRLPLSEIIQRRRARP